MISLNNCTFKFANTKPGESYWASFDEKRFLKGYNFNVYKGILNGNGPKSGSRCVVKAFRKCKGTENLCRCEVKKANQAKTFAINFNEQMRNNNIRVKFSELFWAEMDEVSIINKLSLSRSRKLSASDIVLVEEDLRIDEEQYKRRRELIQFINSRGKSVKCVAKDLEAFAHFTYHHSNGQLIVCDLVGVQDDEGFFLKTPHIHSRNQEYGNRDMGIRGILDVFSNHVCNDICKNMVKPNEIIDNFSAANRDYMPVESGTGMRDSVANGLYQEQDRRMSQDFGNNNGSPLENPESAFFSTSQESCPEITMRQLSSSPHGSSNTFGCREPSAPLVEDYRQDLFHSTITPSNNVHVANWLTQEVQQNNFITRMRSQPVLHPTVADTLSCQMDMCNPRESRKESISSSTNDDLDAHSACTNEPVINYAGINYAARTNCDTNRWNSGRSSGLGSSNVSTTSYMSSRPIDVPDYTGNNNSSFQYGFRLRDLPAYSLSFTDTRIIRPRAVTNSSLSPDSPLFRTPDGLATYLRAVDCCNGKILDSPPSYEESLSDNVLESSYFIITLQKENVP
uniref:Alpha-type protein kinase domain-containing protein n=1 Tax=Arion vulgaris TaxID=1028688 RepID=A0A0B6ZGK1_9EUPU